MSSEYRTKPFIEKLESLGVLSRAGGQISVNTLVALQEKLKLVVKRRSRDKSRVWTDEHAVAIKEYWLKTEDSENSVEETATI